MRRWSRESRAFYQRDLPTEEDCIEWVEDRRYSNAHLKRLWEEQGLLREALLWIEKMRLSTPSNRGKSRWIWKLAEEKFPPQELQDERQDYVEEMADAVEEILRPLPPQDKIKILRPPQQLSVTEWLLWVADHLYDERSEIVAPCKAAAAAWEYYKEEANRHKLYQMLANRVVPKEEKPQEVRVKKEKAEKSKQVKDLERMLSEAAKRAKT